MTNEQFNTLNETIKEGFKQVAEASDNTGSLLSISEEIVDIRRSLNSMAERGVDTFEQNSN
ncbi:hypothetical protein OAK87_00575 [bacterium]|nr:hypothetical protein [bacterium]